MLAWSSLSNRLVPNSFKNKTKQDHKVSQGPLNFVKQNKVKPSSHQNSGLYL